VVESFHQKEHRMVKYVRIGTQSLEGSTSGQAEHENRYTKIRGATKPMFYLVRSLDAMISKTQQKYIIIFFMKQAKTSFQSLFGTRGRGQKTLSRLERA
jgi:hypothetical protein